MYDITLQGTSHLWGPLAVVLMIGGGLAVLVAGFMALHNRDHWRVRLTVALGGAGLLVGIPLAVSSAHAAKDVYAANLVTIEKAYAVDKVQADLLVYWSVPHYSSSRYPNANDGRLLPTTVWFNHKPQDCYLTIKREVMASLMCNDMHVIPIRS